MNLAQNKREVKRRTKFQMSNAMICEENLERGKGRGRWQRKTIFVLLWFLALPSICTATPQKQPFLYMCDFTLARIRTVVCFVMALPGLLSGYQRVAEIPPSSRWKFTPKVEVVWFPFSRYGGVKGLNSRSIF